MMWTMIDTVSTRPATQCQVIHEKRRPMIGKKAVTSSTNARALEESRSIPLMSLPFSCLVTDREILEHASFAVSAAPAPPASMLPARVLGWVLI